MLQPSIPTLPVKLLLLFQSLLRRLHRTLGSMMPMMIFDEG